jgi:hypothetical protein
LRLHKDKNISNVILPFNDNNDEKTICKFLNVMATNDSRIRVSYKSKKLGGYVNIIKAEEDDVKEDVNFKYDVVYDSLGICRNREEAWFEKFEKLKKFIDENDRRPSCRDKYFGMWCFRQNSNFKHQKQSMKNIKIYEIWKEFVESSKYEKYFCSYIKKWYKNLEDLKKYIVEHKKLPSKEKTLSYNNKNIFLGRWTSHQKEHFKHNIDIMKNKKIFEEWTNFINDPLYKIYFLNISAEENWIISFNKYKNFVDKNNKIPTVKECHKLYDWFRHQLKLFKNKLNLMKRDNIYNMFDEFINKSEYSKFFNK